jgi:predicted dehydrogenase
MTDAAGKSAVSKGAVGMGAALRIGIISFAHMHAEGYVQDLRALEGVELVGFTDDDAERAGRYAQQFGLQHFGSTAQLLAAGVDGVIICTETARHLEVVSAAAQAGVHVLCEKPIEVTLERARQMREVCADNGVLFMTAFPMRFDYTLQGVHAALQRGDLGRLLAVQGINHAENPARHRAWFADPELAGGGAVMDHTAHVVDLLRWLLNEDPSSVYAEVSNPFLPQLEVDTAAIATLAFPGGCFATIDASWSRPASYPRWGHLKLELICERGVLAVDPLAQHFPLWSSTGSRTPEWQQWGADLGRQMVQAFVDSICNGVEPPVTWRDGYEALRVALACYEASESGASVGLD